MKGSSANRRIDFELTSRDLILLCRNNESFKHLRESVLAAAEIADSVRGPVDGITPISILQNEIAPPPKWWVDRRALLGCALISSVVTMIFAAGALAMVGRQR
jgi:hypothetical protein